MEERKCSKKTHYPQEFGVGAGTAASKGNERRQAVILCPAKTQGQFLSIHAPGTEAVLGEQMVPLGGEIGSSVSVWMDGATHQSNILMRGAPAEFQPYSPFLVHCILTQPSMFCKRSCHVGCKAPLKNKRSF